MTCQNCRQNFVIYDEDKAFYAKLNVPAPTFCPECRMIRRMTIRNEHALYSRQCDLCKKNIISMYAPDSPFTVYCVDCWNSDKWDAATYARDYDFNKPFFTQFREFMEKVPRISLYQHINEKSDYTNYSVYLKNSYMVFGGHHYEDCFYTANSIYLKDCMDVEFCKNSEKCYQSLHLNKCYNVRFSQMSENCSDSWLLFDCRNCNNCVGCAGLRNKSFCIFNQQYSEEEYFRKLVELRLDTAAGLKDATDKASAVWQTVPRRPILSRNIENSTGDDLENVRNCFQCFSATEDEDCRYSFFLPGGSKEVFDADHVGISVELCYELMSGFENNRVICSNRIYNCHDVAYSDDCHNSSDLFGCIGLRKKSYCIFNKQYPPEEYTGLRDQIIEHMDTMTFTGLQGRVYRFGEFFPVEISPFAYNETMAHDYFPLTREECKAKGYRWKEPTEKHPLISIEASDLPNGITNTGDDITRQIIGCSDNGACNHQCTRAFRVIAPELKFYRESGLPLPRLCPNCRHYGRMQAKNPLKLWQRQCQCDKPGHRWHGAAAHGGTNSTDSAKCTTIFDTSYPPDSAVSVFCDQCYQEEVG